MAPGSWRLYRMSPDSIVNNGDGTETVTWLAPGPATGSRFYMRARVSVAPGEGF